MKTDVTFIGLFLVVIVLAVGSCVVAPGYLKDDAQRAVESAGNTEVSMEDRVFFRCSKDDTVGFSFTAKNPQNTPVSGVVCCGWWKGCTVRY